MIVMIMVIAVLMVTVLQPDLGLVVAVRVLLAVLAHVTVAASSQTSAPVHLDVVVAALVLGPVSTLDELRCAAVRPIAMRRMHEATGGAVRATSIVEYLIPTMAQTVVPHRPTQCSLEL